jgi:uroporphyrinogen III methyltransferase/synthase
VSSPNGADRLAERLAQGGRDMRSLAGRTIAAIGPGTARALAGHGVLADIVPERFVAEGLIEALAATAVERALVVRPRTAREVLAQALRARGAQVDELELYETVAEPLSARVLEQARNADYITFTSSSTVGFFIQAAGGEAALSEGTRIVSIGPATSATLREHGLAPDVQAESHDIDGMLDALLADASARGG